MKEWRNISSALAGARARLLLAMRDVDRTQQNQLSSILAANRDSAFGRIHGFADIRSESEFRQAVPLQTYECLVPYIQNMAQGAERQLTSAAPVAFERTGGSTGGPKLIPYTRNGLWAMQRAIHAWLEDLLLHRAGIGRGRCYWSITPVTRRAEFTPAGTPIGLPSDGAYLGESLKTSLGKLLAVPPGVAQSHSIDQWRTDTVAALRAAPDLTLVSVWSPTFWLELLHHFPEDPRVLWPHLDTISCWTAGSSTPFAQELAARFPGVHVQGKGLLATEGVVTIPLCDYPFPVLAVESGYYEFLDEVKQPHSAAELVDGSDYEVLLTTGSGLYRYQLGDRVRMRGWVGQAPMLEFLGRAGAVSDLCGEKLTENFVQPRLGFLRGFRLLAPVQEPHPGYVLFLDEGEYERGAADTAARRLDLSLSDNPQYEYARQLGQLAAVFPVRVPRAMQRYYQHLSGRGQRLGDIKAPGFNPNGEWATLWHEYFPVSVRSRY